MEELRARLPAQPLVLRVRKPLAAPEALELGRQTAALGVRAVVFDGDPLPEALRRQMTDPTDLGEEMVEWLRTRGVRLTPEVAEILREIFGRAAGCADLGDLLGRIGRSPRTARRHFQRLGLPAPGLWLNVARALRAALRLQREQQTPLLTIATELGYTDQPALSRRMVQLFGLRPSEIRRRLGWEWLVDRWLCRRSAPSNAP